MRSTKPSENQYLNKCKVKFQNYCNCVYTLVGFGRRNGLNISATLFSTLFSKYSLSHLQFDRFSGS